MRILQIHAVDNINNRGGGPIAMYRLHHGLKKNGFESKILCKWKKNAGSDSVAMSSSYKVQKIEMLLRKVTRRIGLNDIHCISSFGVKRNPAYLSADIVNYHGIHGDFFSYLALPRLTANKPSVYTLHDMWPFTAHCTSSYDCDRWKIGCGHCPYPDAPNAIRRDSTRIEWKLKDWVYSRSNFSIVTLSKCRTEQAKQSMLRRFPIHHIPNGIDVDVYQPIDKKACRSVLGLPCHKKVVMFAAPKLSLHGKGGDLLIMALQRLPRALKTELVLLILGDDGEGLTQAVDIPTLNLGYVSNDRLKAVAYSAADLFVSPTRAESLPLVLQESMACGTPLVSFDVGGVPDLVRPGVTGYLAKPEDAVDLSNGIIQLLEDDALRASMSRHCRSIAMEEYPLELQVKRYVQLYSALLQS